MSPLKAIVIGLVQGITEFFPFSFIPHLRIVPALLAGNRDLDDCAGDCALHCGAPRSASPHPGRNDVARWADDWSVPGSGPDPGLFPIGDDSDGRPRGRASTRGCRPVLLFAF